MSYGAIAMPAATRALSRRAAIIGVGESDFGADYAAERAKVPGYEAPTLEGLIDKAFRRALDDAGLGTPPARFRLGVCLGTTVACQLNDIGFYDAYRKTGAPPLDAVDRFAASLGLR